MEKYILANIRTFCAHLVPTQATEESSKGWGGSRNMSEMCNYFTFNVMGDLFFGKAFGMFERGDHRFAIDLIGNAAHRHLIVCKLAPTQSI